MFREIVIETNGMAAVVAEEFAHGAGGVRCDVLHGGRFGGGGGHDDGVVHGPGVGQNLHHLRDGRAFLPDRAVDADHVAALLVDDGVQNDRGLAGLPISDNQFALSAADGNHRVDGFDAGLQGLSNRLPIDDARSNAFNRIAPVGDNRPFAIERHA